MTEIAIDLTAAEFGRLEQVAAANGMSVGELVADELRARYALQCGPPNVVSLTRQPRGTTGGTQ